MDFGVAAVRSGIYISGAIVLGVLLPALGAWYLYFRLTHRRLYQLASKFQTPPHLPFFGHILELRGGPDRIFEYLYSKSFEYENAVCIWVGPRPIILLTHPDDIELILSSHVHIDKAPEYRLFEPWLGDGLLISTGDKWRAHRKLIAPTFHLNVLKNFFPLFNKNSHSVVERLRNELSQEFDCHDYMSETTVEILLETAMGVNKSTQERGYDYAMAVMKMCDILHMRHLKIWFRPEIIFKMTKYAKIQEKLLGIIHGLTQKVLKIRKNQFEKKINSPIVAEKDEKVREEEKIIKTEQKIMTDEKYSFGKSAGIKDDLDDDNDVGQKKRLAFLDLLIECSQQGTILSDEEIQNQVDTIMFEGHDTTAAGSSFFLCLMACHPEIQEKCYQELKEIFGDSDRDVTFQDTLEMKYLERCIMETLRLYPPVPLIARELQEEVRLVSNPDLVIPAKCTVGVGTFKVHRRPDIYPEPERFNPDNFLPENSANRHYYSYIPFSAGPRSCVGRKYAMLKLKVLLSTLLRNFRVLPGMKEKEWVLQGDIILKRTDGFRIRMEERKNVSIFA